MSDDKAVYAVIICEGDAQEARRFKSPSHLRVYAEGFSDGAGCYGAGGASVAPEGELDDYLSEGSHPGATTADALADARRMIAELRAKNGETI